MALICAATGEPSFPAQSPALEGDGAGAVLERQKAETKIKAAPSGTQREARTGGEPLF